RRGGRLVSQHGSCAPQGSAVDQDLACVLGGGAHRHGPPMSTATYTIQIHLDRPDAQAELLATVQALHRTLANTNGAPSPTTPILRAPPTPVAPCTAVTDGTERTSELHPHLLHHLIHQPHAA